MRTQFIQIDDDHGFDINKVVYWKRETNRLRIYFVGLTEPLEFSGQIAQMHYQLLKTRSVRFKPQPKPQEEFV
ncbi:hypothetical protein [Lusitaniella coriacea]|nr:hypothetical protein [Lusitaniella coriacea]